MSPPPRGTPADPPPSPTGLGGLGAHGTGEPPDDLRMPGHYARPMRRPLGGLELDRRTQALLAALCAIELGTRLGRTMPVTVIDRSGELDPSLPVDLGAPHNPPPEPLAWHWTDWPVDALLHLCARDALPQLARNRQSRQPDDALCVELNPPSLPLEAGDAAVRLSCRLGEEMLSVLCVCREGDAWVPAADAIAEMFGEILHGLLTQTHIKASQAPGIGRTSLQQVLGMPTGWLTDASNFVPLAQVIEQEARTEPERCAFRFGNRSLSLGLFDALANALAAQLAAAGVQAGELVPLLLDHSLELPLAELALLKLGAPFVPLDPRASEAELLEALQLLDAPRVVSAAALPAAWTRPTVLVDIDELRPLAQAPQRVSGPAEPAYGVCRRDAEGVLRCVLNAHGGLMNRLRFMSHYFHRDRGAERVLLNAAPAQDASLWQMFWPLTAGGLVVIPGPGAGIEPPQLIDTIGRHGITLVTLAAGVLERLADLVELSAVARLQLASLRELVLGDEAAAVASAAARLDAILPGLRITQSYGPPETSMGVIFHPLVRSDPPQAGKVLGRPLDHCQVIVVDTALRPLPPGACGELLIGGACVGLRYHRDAAASARAFIDNPFPTLAGARLFRTGDLGYIDRRGHLHVVGRQHGSRGRSNSLAPVPERRQPGPGGPRPGPG